jgi:hypothetical protein
MANYFDKNTNEKLPNGDVTEKLQMMTKEIGSIKQKGTEEGLTLADKAHYLAVARELSDAISYYCDLWEKEVAAQDEAFEFKDVGLSVSPKMGRSLTKIADGIFNELTMEEIRSCATVTEKGLKSIGKLDLIEKYKAVTGTSAKSVAYKKL